jgi:hypothetical protein
MLTNDQHVNKVKKLTNSRAICNPQER